MESVWQWGLEVIRWLQSFRNPALDAILAVGGFLGEEEFFFLLFAALLWAVDMRTGFRIGVILLISIYLNSFAKELIAHPRPFDLDPSIGRVQEDLGYGLPSGHAQNAIVVWGGLASWRRTPVAWVGAVSMVLLVSISRIYHGVHFPTDVLGGWIIGVAFLSISLTFSGRLGRWVGQWPLVGQLGLALIGPALLALIFPHGTTEPDLGAITATGTLAGAGSGIAIAWRRLSLDPGGTISQRVLRFVVGLVVLVALYFTLRQVFPGQASPLYFLLRFVRYMLLGMWITLGAPWLFSTLHLAPRRAPRPATILTRA